MLPLTVLRRLDCVLEPTKEKVLEKQKSLSDGKFKNAEPILNRVVGASFHNTIPFTFEKLKGDPDKIPANLTPYSKSFSSSAREIIDHFVVYGYYCSGAFGPIMAPLWHDIAPLGRRRSPQWRRFWNQVHQLGAYSEWT